MAEDASLDAVQTCATEQSGAEGGQLEAPRREPGKPKSQKKHEAREKARLARLESNKRARKRRKTANQEERRKLLDAMTDEERVAFIQKERLEKAADEEALAAFLEESYTRGAPMICFNCSFENAMNEKEKSSLAKQIRLAYCRIKTLREVPVQFHMSSVGKDHSIWSRFEMAHFKNWKMHVHEEDYWTAFSEKLKDGKVVVLSPDAEQYLEAVDLETVYVIGGLVDRTIAKFETRDQASAVPGDAAPVMRKLPVQEYCGRGPTGQVLNVNTVAEIIAALGKAARDGTKPDWAAIMRSIVPQRKQGKQGQVSASGGESGEASSDVEAEEPPENE